MQEKAWFDLVGRTNWAYGPWTREGDKVQWLYRSGWAVGLPGLPCLVVRHPTMGFWRGYVGLPAWHPFARRDIGVAYSCGLVAHGGVNYAGPLGGSLTFELEPGDVEPTWLLGFDCGHSMDLCPYYTSLPPDHAVRELMMGCGQVYRDIHYVRESTEHLALGILRTSLHIKDDQTEAPAVHVRQPFVQKRVTRIRRSET